MSVHTFDPNEERLTPPEYVFASYVPGRDPEWKTYTKRGHATSALSYHGIGSSWEWTGARWRCLDVVVGRG